MLESIQGHPTFDWFNPAENLTAQPIKPLNKNRQPCGEAGGTSQGSRRGGRGLPREEPNDGETDGKTLLL